MPEIVKGHDYITLKEVKGIAPAGTKVRPWTVKEELKRGVGEYSEHYGFTLANGGGFFLKAEDVKEA